MMYMMYDVCIYIYIYICIMYNVYIPASSFVT